jgi:hypothetical protein
MVAAVIQLSPRPEPDADRLGAEAMGRLRARSVCDIEDGLSEAEIAGIEGTFGFRFANDHRAFLMAGLPVNTRRAPREPEVLYTHQEPWPDWRRHGADHLRACLTRPLNGVLFDVEHNAFWYDAWGPRPQQLQEAVGVARERLMHVPTMVPIYGHRYLPAGVGTSGHPVLSMWQTDIIYYGLDISDYIDREFGGAGPGQDLRWEPRATVEFWRDLL